MAMTCEQIRHEANERMDRRRQQAESLAAMRREEIETKLPQVAELRRMLSLTASELAGNILSKGTPEEKDAAFEKIRKNSMDSRAMIEKTLTDAGYPADYDKVKYRCDKCGDTGFTLYGMCGCMKRLINQVASEQLNAQANMPDADFEHFDLEMYRGIAVNNVDAYKHMKKVYEDCIEYADNFTGEGESLLFIGRPGLGKTHLSLAIAHRVTDRGYSAVYGSLLDRLRQTEDEHFGRAEGDTLSLLLDVDLLVLDDLGTEPHTPFCESTLYNIINTRINTRKPVIISTNLSTAELTGTYNERIISRLFYSYKSVPFLGDDVRKILRRRSIT